MRAATPDAMILAAVSAAPVLDLGEPRASMPARLRGPLFDAAVIRLADASRVVVFADCDPLSLSPAERRGYVKDGEAYLTTIAPRR